MQFPNDIWNIIKEFRGIECEGKRLNKGLCGRGKCAKWLPWAATREPGSEKWCARCDPGNEFSDDFPFHDFSQDFASRHYYDVVDSDDDFPFLYPIFI